MFAVVGRRLIHTARRIPSYAVLIVAAAIPIVYAFPGYMNYDAADQLRQARTGWYDDWHPPLMAKYWRILDEIIHGPFLMLVLQIALFVWGAYGLLKQRFQPLTAAAITLVVLAFPPVLAPMGVVWKDAQMVGFLLAGFMLILRESWFARAAGIVLLFFAAGVRDNACTAMPPLLLLAAWTWGYRRKLAICGVAFALFLAITGSAIVANRQLTDERAYAWTKSNAIHDIAGAYYFAPPMTDGEVRKELEGVPLLVENNIQKRFHDLYITRWWLQLAFNEAPIFNVRPDADEREARTAAYWRVVRNHSREFLKHRWWVMRELLGLGENRPDEPVCITNAGTPTQAHELGVDRNKPSFVQRWFNRKLNRYANNTMMFRPWMYLLLGLIMLGYAIWRRNTFVIAVVMSGVLYEAAYFIAAAGAPFRYSNWMILCMCLATLTVFGERLREGIKGCSTRA